MLLISPPCDERDLLGAIGMWKIFLEQIWNSTDERADRSWKRNGSHSPSIFIGPSKDEPDRNALGPESRYDTGH